MNIEQIAKICHEANAAYCETLGDNSQPAWEDAHGWQRESCIDGVKFHLKGETTNISEMAPKSHENWMKLKEKDGWVYGKEKNPEKKTHHCMVPYMELPPEQRMKDFIFCAIVSAFMCRKN